MNMIKIDFMLILALLLAGVSANAGDIPEKGKPCLVSFWFNSCKYCIQELDAVAEKYEQWNKEIPFKIIAVNTDSQRTIAQAKALAASHNWENFEMVWDTNGELRRKYNVVSFPFYMLFDKNGKLVYSHNGYSPGDELKLYEKLKILKPKGYPPTHPPVAVPHNWREKVSK